MQILWWVKPNLHAKSGLQSHLGNKFWHSSLEVGQADPSYVLWCLCGITVKIKYNNLWECLRWTMM
jgi:hypothetical protein